VFVGFKKGIKCYKIWDPKDKKFILSKDVTFDEASMMKPRDSQQVESETTDIISQQVDTTSPSIERSVSFEIIPAVAQGGDYVTDQDADADVEDQGQAMGNVQEFIAVERACRNSCKPSWLTTNMIVTYALPVVEEAIPSTGKLKSV